MISELGPVAAVLALKHVSVRQTSVSDLGLLTGFPALVTLDAADTPVVDVSMLATLPVLAEALLSSTQVSDLEVLESAFADFEHCVRLSFEGAPVSEASLSESIPALRDSTEFLWMTWGDLADPMECIGEPCLPPPRPGTSPRQAAQQINSPSGM